MKKILFSILAFILVMNLTSCSKEDNPEDDITYLDNSIIAGRWYWIQATDSVVWEFEDNRAREVVYDRYTKYLKQTLEYGSYKITTDRIFFLVLAII